MNVIIMVQDQISKINTKEGTDINILLNNIMTNLDHLIPAETYESQKCHIRTGEIIWR